MNIQELYPIIKDHQDDFNELKPTVKRNITKEVINKIKLDMPIVITGVRRCGKSYLLKLIKDELKLDKKEYLYINFNDDRFVKFENEDYQNILNYLIENNYNKRCYLFLDEIQEVKGWEKWIDRIKNKFIIFITGSNSKILSSEISTILTGRTISIKLTPFNFTEYLEANKINYTGWIIDSKLQLMLRKESNNYLKIGGIPKRVLNDDDIIIKELYENIIYRDIIYRYGKLTKQIKEISLFLLSNSASQISSRTLSKISGIKNYNIIKSILDLFQDSYLYFNLNKFEYSLKVQLQNPRKVYCIDNGFLSILGFRMSEDYGRLMENLTAIELKRRGKEIFYYLDKKECDFVVRTSNKITEAIQVCYDLNEGNKEREYFGLIHAMDKFKLNKGLIINYNREEEIKIKNKVIKIIPLWKWLIEDL